MLTVIGLPAMGTMLGEVALVSSSSTEGMEMFPLFIMMAMMSALTGGLLMDRLMIALVALLGGLVAGLDRVASILKSPSHGRKFGGSVVRSLIAAAVFTVGYQLSGWGKYLDLLLRFLWWCGVDVLGSRIAGCIGNNNFPLSKSKEDKEQ
jgi:hypothetical protein